MERRVVITGMGLVSPVGNTVETFWDNLTNGRSGIRTIELIDTHDMDCRIAGEVRGFDPKPFFKKAKDIRRSDRFAQFGMAAAVMAINDADLRPDQLDPTRIGCMIGSGIGGLTTMCTQSENLITKSASRVSPFTIPMMISNIASGMVSIDYDLRGPNMSIVTACATSNHNIGEAWRMIKFGDADAFVAGGSEATVTRLGVAGFSNMKALSTRNDDPEGASRPFDKERDGFIMGEGAGVVVIEELEHAKKRGANILAELIGYGVSADAYHLTSPHPEGAGAALCMEMAIRHGGISPEEVSYVNAHGTSTPMGDVCETKAIKKVFGNFATDGLMVSSTKSMTGHLLGAAGGVELAACVRAVMDNVIPPTINLENKDPECDLDYVPNTARETNVNIALTNSFGFGGHNASLLIKKYS
jgi:3-oxoacyl-[acyl-carrier-protein] synthase II